MPLVELPALHDGRSDKSEMFKLVNQIRSQVNLYPEAANATLTTAGTGALTMIWGAEVPLSSANKLTASVLGVTADLTQSCAYTLECAVVNAAGVVTFTGGSFATTFSRETAAGTDAQFVISGTTLQVHVQDAGVQTTYWRVTIYAEALG